MLLKLFQESRNSSLSSDLERWLKSTKSFRRDNQNILTFLSPLTLHFVLFLCLIIFSLIPQVLRFLRLFGPGKNMPSVWRSARRKRKRKQREPHSDTATGDNESNPPEGVAKKKSGWDYEYAPPPPPEQCLSDDEVMHWSTAENEYWFGWNEGRNMFFCVFFTL